MLGDCAPGARRGLLTRVSATIQSAWRTDAIWLWLLYPLTLVYRSGLFLRRRLFRSGWLSVYQSPVPVVVVGNITVGGTGKTPVVGALSSALRARGFRVGIVSRGYGAAPGAFPRRVTPGSAWQDCGDEPLMLARQTGCPVVVAPRRADAVKALLQWQALDLIISDDGLQHLALARDLEIVLLDPSIGLGNGRLLPAGPLREPAARLAAYDWVLQRDSKESRRHFRYRIEGLVNVRTGRTCPADTFSRCRVDAVAGIANPEGFFASLRDIGMDVSGYGYPDHHAFVAEDFVGLGERPVIMTEKDAVKCRPFAGPDFWFLKITAELPQALIDRVAFLLDAGSARPQE